MVHNSHKLPKAVTQTPPPLSPFSHSTPALREASTLKQVSAAKIDLKSLTYTLLKKLDVSQLQSGSNLSTFIQCCMQIYKPCLSMLMFPMMFTRGFATVIYFIWKALGCNGDEPQCKTLWERARECETEMRMRIKTFLLRSS